MTDSLEPQLDVVADTLRAVSAEQQREADPSHEDFYSWGWLLSEVTGRLQEVGGMLGRQVAGYGSRRILRDDEGGDPAARLAEARAHLDEMAAALGAANNAARLYHSAIGHVAVEVAP